MSWLYYCFSRPFANYKHWLRLGNIVSVFFRGQVNFVVTRIPFLRFQGARPQLEDDSVLVLDQVDVQQFAPRAT